ncbi:MAG: ADP-ribosylglycohydrolase family protein [Armatimonadota bacterium]
MGTLCTQVCGLLACTHAFFERDVRRVVNAALGCVPMQSRLARCISDVILWYSQFPDDWTRTWTLVERKYQNDVDCQPGKPANIDAVVNSAYVAIALLHGDGDMERTMEIATRCGQDSDCNAASACGVLGCSLGLSKIPEKYKSYLSKLEGHCFAHTAYTYQSVIEACVELACRAITDAGGRIVDENGKKYEIIPFHEPLPPITYGQWSEESQKRMLGLE